MSGQRDRGGGERGERRPQRNSKYHDEPEDDGSPALGCVYGVHPISELIATDPQRISRLYLLERDRSAPLGRLLTEARKARVPFDFTGRARLHELAQTDKHQGVVAQVAVVPYVPLSELIERAAKDTPGLIVVLDGVSDPRNLGAVMRTAEAAGAHGIIIPKRRAAPLTDLVAKVSAGAFMHLPLVRVDNVSNALEILKKAGYWVFGLAAEAKNGIGQMDFSVPTVLVLGSEGKGLKPLVARHCDQLVGIPLKGKTPSLNISVAAAVAIFTVQSQRGGWGL